MAGEEKMVTFTREQLRVWSPAQFGPDAVPGIELAESVKEMGDNCGCRVRG